MAINDVLRNFDKIVGGMEKEAKKAVYEVSGDLLNESVKLTPIDSGNLRKSGKITETNDRNNRYVLSVSFGDSRVKYAAAVHEINKNYIEPGTGWKYLERPLKQNANKYIKYLRNRIGRKL